MHTRTYEPEIKVTVPHSDWLHFVSEKTMLGMLFITCHSKFNHDHSDHLEMVRMSKAQPSKQSIHQMINILIPVPIKQEYQLFYI